MKFPLLSLLSLCWAVSSEYANSTEPKGISAGKIVDTGACSYSATCTSGGYEGVCVSISAGCCSGTVSGMIYRPFSAKHLYAKILHSGDIKSLPGIF